MTPLYAALKDLQDLVITGSKLMGPAKKKHDPKCNEPADIDISFPLYYRDDRVPFHIKTPRIKWPEVLDPNHLPPHSAHVALKQKELRDKVKDATKNLLNELNKIGPYFEGPFHGMSFTNNFNNTNLFICLGGDHIAAGRDKDFDSLENAHHFLSEMAKLGPADRLFFFESDHPGIGAHTGRDVLKIRHLIHTNWDVANPYEKLRTYKSTILEAIDWENE